MSKALYRYQRKHYKRITVRRELYEKLKRFADELNLSIPGFIKMLVEEYEKRRGASSA
jgi:predicted CopG family antitoxin